MFTVISATYTCKGIADGEQINVTDAVRERIENGRLEIAVGNYLYGDRPDFLQVLKHLQIVWASLSTGVPGD